jgi:hypothetical protein
MGMKYTRELYVPNNRVEVIDPCGFESIIIDLPRNDQPYTPYTGPLVPYQNIRATNFNSSIDFQVMRNGV